MDKLKHWIKNVILKMLGCFNPIMGQIWTNSNIGLKCNLKNAGLF